MHHAPLILAAFLAAQPAGEPPTPITSAPPGTAPVAPPVKPAPPAKPTDADTPAEPAKPAVAFPHPLISEVLYAVPTGDIGDANGDGLRSATGDEFIEVVNPHAKAINLRGYVLTDKSLGKPGTLRFVFPACTLGPGEVAVVFNGFESSWAGPVGDADGARGGNDRFHGAKVFTMKAPSNRQALANAGDAAILSAPDGATIQVVKWGKIDGKLPGAKLVEEAPITNRGSVERDGTQAGSRFRAHPERVKDGSAERVRYSPGLFAPHGAAADREREPGAGGK